jgi:sterol desaturase/sphingolipid hydroxylase (fatty acid hydroxylase superfamily)
MTWKERLRLFQSFWIMPMAGAASLAVAKRLEPSPSLADLLWTVPLGLLLWTLLEYGLHRFVFHVTPRNAVMGRMLDALHQQHHRMPRNAVYLLVRTPYALGISSIVAAILAAVTQNLFWTAGLMCGIWIGFLCYESVHYRVHLTAAEGGWVGRRRRAHFDHHFRDPARRFGVTSSFWDSVFGTR